MEAGGTVIIHCFGWDTSSPWHNESAIACLGAAHLTPSAKHTAQSMYRAFLSAT